MPAEVKLAISAPADGATPDGATRNEPPQEEATPDGRAQARPTRDGPRQDGPTQAGSTQAGPAPHNPIRIDADTCVKCDLCDWICPGDLIYKKPDDRETLPEIRYPDECWYCGLCQSICPVDAITIIFPKQMIRCRTDVTTLLGKVIE